MALWIAKAIVQKTISYLPWRQRLNLFFQRNVTRGIELSDEHFHWKLTHASDHYRYFSEFGHPHPARKIFEIGTGWYPVVPLYFYLTNAGQVTSADLTPWLTASGFQTTVAKLSEWRHSGRLSQYFPEGYDEERWSELLDLSKGSEEACLNQWSALIGLRLLVGDASRTGIEERTMDFICSNNTFEHIYPDALENILCECWRLLKAGGCMSHFIDLSDHFAHFDKSITIYNFLRFSQRRWLLIDNGIQPQNRWRWPDYLGLYQKTGIPITQEDIRPGDRDALSTVPIHPEYEGYTPEELAISHGYIVSLREE